MDNNIDRMLESLDQVEKYLAKAEMDAQGTIFRRRLSVLYDETSIILSEIRRQATK